MPVEAWHVERIAGAMRQADRDEILKLNGVTPRQGLDLSLAQYGKHWTGLVDGVPVAIFGVVPVSVIGGAGVVWLLGANDVMRHRHIFARVSREIVSTLLEDYDVLMNIVHAENRVALRWLAWLGATFKQSGNRVYFEIRGKP